MRSLGISSHSGSAFSTPNGEADIAIHPSKPRGAVQLAGAKNSALRLLAASILFRGAVRIERCPRTLSDITVHTRMLTAMGHEILWEGDDTCIVQPEQAPSPHLFWEGRSIRNTLLILGANLARFGEASVPLPGGCEIGERPYDLHQDLIESLGGHSWVEGDRLCAEALNGQGLRGGSYRSHIRSTGLTENALLMGALNMEGVELVNPHLTPEVRDLVKFLQSAGVEVAIRGNESIYVRGRTELVDGRHRVLPDRIEAVTWALAAVAGRGTIEIVDFPTQTLPVAIQYLQAAGAELFTGPTSVIVRGRGPQPISLSAGSEPGVHSDMQPLFGATAALALGRSDLYDHRYPDRFGYVSQLGRLGVPFDVSRGSATIYGKGVLTGGSVSAEDLRAGAAMLIAALGAQDVVRIKDAWQISRGYDQILQKLESLGIQHDILPAQ